MQGEESLKLSPESIRLGFAFVPSLSVCSSFEALVGALSSFREVGQGSNHGMSRIVRNPHNPGHL